MVVGEIGRMEKRERERERERENRREWFGDVFGWGREEEEILVGPRSFLPWPTKHTISPNWGENERKLCKTFWTKMPMSKPIVYVLVPFSSYSLFLKNF